MERQNNSIRRSSDISFNKEAETLFAAMSKAQNNRPVAEIRREFQKEMFAAGRDASRRVGSPDFVNAVAEKGKELYALHVKDLQALNQRQNPNSQNVQGTQNSNFSNLTLPGLPSQTSSVAHYLANPLIGTPSSSQVSPSATTGSRPTSQVSGGSLSGVTFPAVNLPDPILKPEDIKVSSRVEIALKDVEVIRKFSDPTLKGETLLAAMKQHAFDKAKESYPNAVGTMSFNKEAEVQFYSMLKRVVQDHGIPDPGNAETLKDQFSKVKSKLDVISSELSDRGKEGQDIISEVNKRVPSITDRMIDNEIERDSFIKTREAIDPDSEPRLDKRFDFINLEKGRKYSFEEQSAIRTQNYKVNLHNQFYGIVQGHEVDPIRTGKEIEISFTDKTLTTELLEAHENSEARKSQDSGAVLPDLPTSPNNPASVPGPGRGVPSGPLFDPSRPLNSPGAGLGGNLHARVEKENAVNIFDVAAKAFKDEGLDPSTALTFGRGVGDSMSPIGSRNRNIADLNILRGYLSRENAVDMSSLSIDRMEKVFADYSKKQLEEFQVFAKGESGITGGTISTAMNRYLDDRFPNRFVLS